MKKFFFLTALFGILAYAPAHASDVRMDDIVISANKIETSASEVTSSVTVITEEDMEAQQNRTLVDALKTAPGVFWGNQQGPAGTNTLWIRGSSRYTQLRYNGIPLRESTSIENNYDTFLGVFNLAPGAVNRIEVLKGSQGTLYGSSAMGGVVSIYSGDKWNSGFNASLDLSGGSYGTFTASGQLSYGDNKWYVNFTPLYTRSDGFNDIWYKQGGFALSAGLRLTEKTSVELTSMLTASENAPFYQGYSGRGQWTMIRYDDDDLRTNLQSLLTGITLTHEVCDKWTVQGKAAFTNTDRDYRSDGSDSEFIGNTYYLELLNTIRPLDNLTVIAGAEYEGQGMEKSSHGKMMQEESAGAFSAYAKGLLSFLDKKLVLSAGGRFNKHDDFDSKATWDLGLSYSFDTGTRVFGNVATGFYTPSLYQRYGDGGPWLKGNPDLDAESSISYELGVEQKLWSDKLLLSASVFTTDYEDYVNYGYGSDWVGYYYNADEAKARGFELGLSVQPNDIVRLDLSYTHTSSKQKVNENSDWVHGSRVPEDKVAGTLYLFPIEKLKLSVTGRWEDERRDAEGYLMDDSYFTVDLAATYDVTDHLQVYAKINNLLDEDYAVYGWEMPGINAMAGMKFRF